MADYRINLINRAEREATIKAAVKASFDERPFYEFRNQVVRLKVVRVDLGLPIYRIENCRTFTDQKEFASRENKSATYFSHGQENESVQQVQHDILKKLAETGRDSVTPIVDVLRTEKQRQEILITHTGVVVNGNRRLAAMRELFASSAAEFQDFSHVNCMVLPEDATPDDVLDIEAALQGKQEAKLDYDWIADCHLIMLLQQRKRTTKQIADRLHRREAEIKNSLRAFTQAQIYLKEWAREEGKYSLVRDDGEQFFNDLAKSLENRSEREQAIARAIAFTLFDKRKTLNDRLYAFNVNFGKRANDVMDQLAEELGVDDVAVNNGGIDQPDDGGDFAIEIDEVDAPLNSHDKVLELLNDPEKRAELSDSLVDVCRSIVEHERDKKSGQAAQMALNSAHSKLVSLDLSKAEPKTYTTLAKQLAEIATITASLQAKLATYTSKQSGQT